jgi:hypothetical protein
MILPVIILLILAFDLPRGLNLPVMLICLDRRGPQISQCPALDVRKLRMRRATKLAAARASRARRHPGLEGYRNIRPRQTSPAVPHASAIKSSSALAT